LHTGGKSIEDYRRKYTGQGFTVRDFEHMKKADDLFDGLEIYLSLWDYDDHAQWHVWNWEKEADQTVMQAFFEAEQYSPYSTAPDDIEEFEKIWERGEYEPGGTYCFDFENVEVLEVLQEEENPHDSYRTRRAVQRAEHEKRLKRDKQWMKRKAARCGKRGRRKK
jgi:hypothetical protein